MCLCVHLLARYRRNTAQPCLLFGPRDMELQQPHLDWAAGFSLPVMFWKFPKKVFSITDKLTFIWK